MLRWHKACGKFYIWKILNGGRYTVTRIGPDRIALKENMADDEFEVTSESISKHCTLAWALCYPKVQGCTEQGTILLHNMDSQYLRRCHLYVGLSRTTDGSNVFIARD